MYHLAKGVYNRWTRQDEYSVLILGLDNAGKTTLLERLKTQFNGKGLSPDRITPTVGQNMGYITVQGVRLKLWDVGGQANLRSLWASYYQQCHAIVYVVDSADRDRIEDCKAELKNVAVDDQLEGVPLLMLANKQDSEERLDIVDIIEIFNQMAEHIVARDSRVLPVSALTGDGVVEAAEWLAVRLVRNKEYRPPNLV